MITFSNLGNQGRLGNQLYQIASVIALALKNKDTYIFPQWQYEAFFNLKDCFSSEIKPTKKFLESGFHYTEIPYNISKNEILDLSGYFQSKKYFEHCEDEIKRLLTPKNIYETIYDVTSLHVRRGDYLTFSKEFNQLDMNYYNKAMSIIKSKYYLIFSDDIKWCKKNFIGDQFMFSEGKNPAEDLSLMISCENNIIANSSFSWWGAYLNKNKDKKIIYPKTWFGPNLLHDTKDLIPEGWIKI